MTYIFHNIIKIIYCLVLFATPVASCWPTLDPDMDRCVQLAITILRLPVDTRYIYNRLYLSFPDVSTNCMQIICSALIHLPLYMNYLQIFCSAIVINSDYLLQLYTNNLLFYLEKVYVPLIQHVERHNYKARWLWIELPILMQEFSGLIPESGRIFSIAVPLVQGMTGITH